ncbi:hypothetical protein E5S67_06400 [Microcoleus sp. IPMA8]|uniref:Uncharacterized protein n=1 Tax=Microcoleus asticus IPMA8 TaxID=2563858 RepID=A0ABX2DAJ7_9CYAN|nr:hypothetical protein [Microcoleus asticus IPMA8]
MFLSQKSFTIFLYHKMLLFWRCLIYKLAATTDKNIILFTFFLTIFIKMS